MSIALGTLVDYCNKLLSIDSFSDGCVNGLQVEGKNQIARIASAVTASQETLNTAVMMKADLLMVHHGYFWKRDPLVVTGLHKRRLNTLMMADMSLLAYHLPLDAHSVYGNNQQLANQLGLVVEGGLPGKLGLYGHFKQQTTLGEVVNICSHQLTHQPLVIPASYKNSSVIKRLAWCTGAAADLIFEAKSIGVNAFITGEINERAVHWANELDVVLIAAGHHATERYGVKALADHLSEQFSLEHNAIEIYSPV